MYRVGEKKENNKFPICNLKMNIIAECEDIENARLIVRALNGNLNNKNKVIK
ncbi:hypothetical protein QJR26_09455 [Clostridium baratii]